MSEKTLRTLATVAGVLVLLWGGTLLLGRYGSDEGGQASALAGVLSEVGPEAVSEVRFSRPDGDVVLASTERGWTVDGYRADSALVAGFWSVLSGAEVRGPVARNAENHARMGVDEASATEVVFVSDGEERAVLLGDAGSSPGTAFARLPGEDAVYLVPSGVRGHVTRSVEGWRDDRVVTLDTARVARISVEGEESWALERAEGGWRMADGEAADSSVVADILSELAGLRASGFLEASDSVALLPESASLLATAASGDTLALLRLGEGGSARWARVRGDSVIYRLGSYRVGRVLPSAGELRGR